MRSCRGRSVPAEEDEGTVTRKEKYMTDFNIHTFESAPQDSKPALELLQRQVGFIPNLAATMAESPYLLEAFTSLRAINGRGAFTPVEREAIALAVSFENNCTYCMAAHSTFARKNGIPEEDLRLLRAGKSPSDPRLQAIIALARQIVRSKGHLASEDIQRFLKAGFSRAQLLEVVLGITSTSISNYMHNIAKTPIDDAFLAQSWTASS
ncbi:MAG TPA: carboxymuconolactone decarboxylase family protein [Pyrinomonadaceae bacterium]|nr:carboxymuconolactone decarboxylase family protein [Pyrinomonadaceae bacterium]